MRRNRRRAKILKWQIKAKENKEINYGEKKLAAQKRVQLLMKGDLKTQNEQPVMMIRRGRGQNAKNG